MLALLIVVLVYAIQFAVIARVLLRPGMLPTVRLSWVMVVAVVPIAGLFLYLLFGEVRLARGKVRRITEVLDSLAAAQRQTPAELSVPGPGARVPFATGTATSGFLPVTGNTARMLPEGDAEIDDLIEGIDAAAEHVHLLFYIWLPDTAGTQVAEAAIRAAGRGVAVRVLVDDLGSRALVRSALWERMRGAGVTAVRAAPLHYPLVSFVVQRLDVRNHRKVAVVDGVVAWCGSRNCADTAFLPKAKFGPWIDILLRLHGPVVRQMQVVFLKDWLIYRPEDAALIRLLDQREPPREGGFTAQVIVTGPDQSRMSLVDTIAALLYGAKHQAIVTTPYFVPDRPTLSALCAVARRGVEVTLILPARNDNWVVGAAAESHYDELLRAGVRLRAFGPGLLHSKIITVDGRLALIGSTNIDRRSFDLNYENAILIDSEEVTGVLDARQTDYMRRSVEVTLDEVMAWSRVRRIRNNSVALAEPLL
ncbi:MAG TPA: cardiolipin synthase [Thioalkalivibrio sp.]|nr:cardiolipin synthase [Thioalkalivibrio sp.]